MKKILLITLGVVVFLAIIAVISWQFFPLVSKRSVYTIREKDEEYSAVGEGYRKGDFYYLRSTVTKEKEKQIVNIMKTNKYFETLEWIYKDPAKKIYVNSVREGNKIILTGDFNGKQNNREEIIVDDREWQQVFLVGITNFAVTKTRKDNVEFWCMDPNAPWKPLILAATKEGIEEIMVNGKPVLTERVRINVAGMFSFLWAGKFWFRLSNGDLIKAEMNGGMTVQFKEVEIKIGIPDW